MQQVKIFKSIESEVTQLEQQMNDWLAEHQARIVHITGNIAPQTGEKTTSGGQRLGGGHVPSDVMIVVVYAKA